MHNYFKMRKFILLLIFISIAGTIYSQNTKTTKKFNKSLADSLQADDYGMKNYVFVILKTGTNTDTNSIRKSEAFKGHMKNMDKLVAEGKLIVAGPFHENNKNYRGLFVLNVNDTTEAQTILNTDPAINQKYLQTELYKWYGSAALPLYFNFTNEIQKKAFE